eukprot:153047-Chlamydomonas_euryale.AAC.14
MWPRPIPTLTHCPATHPCSGAVQADGAAGDIPAALRLPDFGCAYGLHAWAACMGCMHGLHACAARMGCMHGLHTWSACETGRWLCRTGACVRSCHVRRWLPARVADHGLAQRGLHELSPQPYALHALLQQPGQGMLTGASLGRPLRPMPWTSCRGGQQMAVARVVRMSCPGVPRWHAHADRGRLESAALAKDGWRTVN